MFDQTDAFSQTTRCCMQCWSYHQQCYKQGFLAYLTWPCHVALYHELVLCPEDGLAYLEPELKGMASHLYHKRLLFTRGLSTCKQCLSLLFDCKVSRFLTCTIRHTGSAYTGVYMQQICKLKQNTHHQQEMHPTIPISSIVSRPCSLL